MADIFISYSREDRSTAERLANALEKQSWSVWVAYVHVGRKIVAPSPVLARAAVFQSMGYIPIIKPLPL